VSGRALEGRVAIVTGAGRGIGKIISLAYAEAGAAVTVASRTASTVNAVAGEIAAAGGKALGVTCDVGERSQVDSMVAATVERFGRIDILVNNAQSVSTTPRSESASSYEPLETYPEDIWDHTYQTGLKATLYAMQAVFPHLRERGGKIINFGSGNGIANMKGTAAYNVTKEAIRSLTRTAAMEWGKHGICVNVVIPAIVTDMAADFLASRPAFADQLLASIPLRRMGESADIGPAMVFLASAASDYITGQTIHIDGGLIMRP
jgi:2-hydroxycyclohexanecarboxyl-CoA dehydrogenase